MKQRQTVGNGIGLAQILQHRAAEPRCDLHAMGMGDEFRRTGGAAGVEISRDVVAAPRLPKRQRIAVLRLQAGVQIPNTPSGNGASDSETCTSLTSGSNFPTSTAFCQMSSCGCGPSATKIFASAARTEIGDVLRLKQKIDRHSVALRFCSP